MKILSGVYTPTSGKIIVKGKEYSKLTPQDSYDLGISIIYQELSVINELSILENLFVGKLPTKKAGIISVVDYDKMREIAADVLGKVGEMCISDSVLLWNYYVREFFALMLYRLRGKVGRVK